MAWQNCGWAWSVVGVRGSHYVVLHALVEEADRKGIVDRLTLQRLSRLCNVSFECARKLTGDLKDWGFIDIQERTTSTGQKVSNRYELHLDRLFPKSSGIEQPGEDIGSYIWQGLVQELERMRGPVETYLLKNQMREAFFDRHNRCNKMEQWKGVLYVILESDAVQTVFDQNLNYLLKLRDFMTPYLIDWFEPIIRPTFVSHQGKSGNSRPDRRTHAEILE